MNKIIVAMLVFSISSASAQVTLTQAGTRPASTSTRVKQPNTAAMAISYAASPELIRAFNWWRQINPGDISIYNSPFNIATHTMHDTTYAKFAAKTSLSFKGWYNPAGFPYWSPDSMVNLLPLINLKQINLSGSMVSNISFKYLGQLPQLRAVYCNNEVASCDPLGLNVDDEGFRALLQNRDLEYIGFKDLNRVTEAGYASLTKMKNLKVLYLFCGSITDRDLLFLEGCTSLETLYLIRTSVTDAGLQNLLTIKNSLPSLKMIYVNYSKTTRKGEDDFRAAWGKPINIIF